MSNESTQSIQTFKGLPYEAKFQKVKLMVDKLQGRMPFFKEMSDMFRIFKKKINENVLEYLYSVIMTAAYTQTTK